MENNFYTKKPTSFILRSVFITISIILSLAVMNVSATVNVTATNSGNDANYPTLKAAFDAINAGTHTGVVNIEIASTPITETVSAVLNQTPGVTSVTIRPTAGAARTITGNIIGHLIDLNGADNVTIDGLNTGGASLTIANTNNATGASSTIRLRSDASNNTITNCNIQGSNVTNTSGTIFFSTGTTTGNDFNTVSNCNIGPVGTNYPIIGILSVGSTAGTTTNLNNAVAINNSNNTITGNNIFDWYNNSATSQGVNIGNGNCAWSITNNRLYQTTTKVFTLSGNASTAITCGGTTSTAPNQPVSGDGYVITGNTVGFANSSGTGFTKLIGNSVDLAGFPTSYTPTGTAVALSFRGIVCTSNAGSPTNISVVNNNTIGGIALYSSNAGGSYNPLIGNGGSVGIGVIGGIVLAGTINCGVTTGNIPAPNIIGSTTGTGSIYLVSTTAGVSNSAANTGATICGIFGQSSSGVQVSKLRVENNQMGAWDVSGSTSLICGGISGIVIQGSADNDVLSNVIGNSTNPNLRMGFFTTGGGVLSNTGTFSTSSGKGEFRGILNLTSATSALVYIGKKGLGNIIQNASINTTSATAYFKGIEGLRTGAAAVGNLFARHGIIEGNEIRNITSLCSSTARVVDFGVSGVSNAELAGIGIYDAGTTDNTLKISDNYVHDLSLTNAGTGGYSLAGIVYHLPLGASATIFNNRICGLSNASTSASATVPGLVAGIYVADGNGVDNKIYNNMISLGNGQTTNTAFIGLWCAGPSFTSTIKAYHNSINISGTAASGAQPSFAFSRGDFSATAFIDHTIDARNNIFVNSRSGGTGKHYAIANDYGATASATGWGSNASDYNILNATASTVGYWSADKTFSDWKTASSSDPHSFSGVTVNFVDACNLHLNMGVAANFIESQGITGTGVVDDIDGDVRPGPAGSVNGGASQPDLGADEFDGNPIYPPTITMLLPATASVCGLTSHLVRADIVPITGTLTSVTLFWNNGTPGSVAMTNTSGNTYEATIPAASGLQLVSWRIEASNSGGVTKTFFGTSYTDPIPPAAPITTDYSVCNGTVPPGAGLTATCVAGGTNNIPFTITPPTTDETATGSQGSTSVCPGNTVIGSFVIPPLVSGATITYAGVTINGIKLLSLGSSTSYGSEMELSFSGTGILGGGPTSCFSGATSPSTPLVISYITGQGLGGTADIANLIASLNPAGGTITVTYNESYNDIPGGPDVLFPTLGTFTIVTTLPSTIINWYNTPSGPLGVGLEGSGSPFDPLTQAGLPNVTGVYPYYARCIAGNCGSVVGSVANFYINQPLVVNTTQSLTGSICAGTPDQLSSTAVGGGEPYSYSWSPAAGLSNRTIANPIATPTSTTIYTLTVTDACSNIKRSTITVTIIPSPSVDISPRNGLICRATDGPFTLTASGADFYAWSPAAGLNSTTGSIVTAFPLGNTDYVVLGTLTNGCTGTQTATIFSDDKPLITAIATPPNLCTSPNSTQLSVSTNPAYCVLPEQGQSGGFRQVTFNTLNNFPFFPAIAQYNVHAPVGNNTTTLVAGSTYNLFASTVVNVANITSVWIDFNHDGDYSIDEWRAISTGAASATVAIPIPLTAVNGLTGMRLRQRNFANDAYSACIPWQSGSTEEYTVRIVGGVDAPLLQSYSWSPATYLNNAASPTPVATNVLSNTTYTVTVTNDVGCVNTSSVTVSASPLATAPTAVQTAVYCTNTNNSNAGTIYISNVTLGAAINNTTTVSGQQFGIYTAPNPGLLAGTTYPISVSVKGALGVAVWIDYNQSGTFDFFELEYHDFTGNVDETYSGSITIPASAFNGQTRMRIRALQNFDPVVYPGVSVQNAPCADFVTGGTFFDNGETEDYFLTISNGVNHANPCSGATFQLEANASGGGSPYTYSWAPSAGVSAPSFSSPTAVVTSTTTYTVTVTDVCGTIRKGLVTVTLTPPPVISVTYDGNGTGGICGTGNVTITASSSPIAADFYTWSPSVGLDNTDQDAVLASPTQTTYYVVTGSSGGCTATASAPVVVFDPMVFDASANGNVITGCNPFSTQLHAGIPSASIVITEVTFNREGTGATSPYPSYITTTAATDFVEISNVTNNDIDISGYTLDDYITTSVISNHPFTFPPGTILPAQKVAVLHLGTSAGNTPNSPANRYFNTEGTTNQYLTNSTVGFVLKNGSTVVDAVGCGAGYIFDPGTGVTGADWAGNAPSAAGLAGVVRTKITDNNIGTDWEGSDVVNQNLGTYSAGMISIQSYVWTPSTGLSSTTVENPFVTNLTSNTTYNVSVTNSYGCTGSSSITLFVNPTPTAPVITPGGSTTFCSGNSVGLTASGGGASPVYTWSPATGLNQSVGSAVTASPTVTTTYTVTVTIAGGCTASNTITINVNSANTPTITPAGNPSFCTPGSVLLNASAPGPYTGYSWSLGTSIVGASSTYLATAGGTYVVTVTAPNTCTTTASVLVIANAPPAAPVVTLVGTLPICDNFAATVLLDATTIPGVTYFWNNQDGATTEDYTVPGNDNSFIFAGTPYFDFHVTVTDANGCSAVSNDVHVTTIPCGILFNMKMYIQGFYNVSTGFMDGDPLNYPNSGCLNILYQNSLSTNTDPEDVDTVNVSLMDEFAYTLVETQRGVLKRNGTLSVTFTGPAVAGTNYWIQLKHRNLEETWSKSAIYFSSSTTYDFTTASTQAYDEGPLPMIEVAPGVWACFNGDIDQDGAITSLDMTAEENDANINAFGYYASDLDGDAGSTSLDMTIIENNANYGVFLADPLP